MSQDASSWVQNIAYDYQQAGGGGSAPVVSQPSTYAPQSGGAMSSVWNILNGISGAIDGVQRGLNTGQGGTPLNPSAPYYNQYGVPMNPGAPGTTPGPGSGFVDQPIIAGLTGLHISLILAALVAGYVVMKK